MAWSTGSAVTRCRRSSTVPQVFIATSVPPKNAPNRNNATHRTGMVWAMPIARHDTSMETAEIRVTNRAPKRSEVQPATWNARKPPKATTSSSRPSSPGSSPNLPFNVGMRDAHSPNIAPQTRNTAPIGPASLMSRPVSIASARDPGQPVEVVPIPCILQEHATEALGRGLCGLVPENRGSFLKGLEILRHAASIPRNAIPEKDQCLLRQKEKGRKNRPFL